jgi:integrase
MVRDPHNGRNWLDFGQFLGRGYDHLATGFRDAFLGQVDVTPGKMLVGTYHALRPFFRFLDYRADSGSPVTNLGEIDSGLLVQYLSWLKNRPEHSRAGTWASIYAALIAVLEWCVVHIGDRVSEDVALDNLPKGVYRGVRAQAVSRVPYSLDEMSTILGKAGADLRLMMAGEWNGPKTDFLALALLAISALTGRNPAPLLELRRDCLKTLPSKKDQKERTILESRKRRGYSTHMQTVKVPTDVMDGADPVPLSVGTIIAEVMDRTNDLVAQARPDDRNYLFLYQPGMKNGTREPVGRVPGGVLLRRLKEFVKRHDIRDDGGRLLASLDFARWRPSFAVSIHELNGGDINETAQIVGDKDVAQFARTYLKHSPRKDQGFASVLENLQRYVTGETTPARASKTEGDCSVSAPGCTPAGSPLDLFAACFSCPRMCVIADDLRRLIAYRNKYLAAGSSRGTDPSEVVTWVIRRIDETILPQFPSRKVDAARKEIEKCRNES